MHWSAIAWFSFLVSFFFFFRKLWSFFSKLLCCLLVLAVICGQSSFGGNQVGFDVGIFHFRHCERCVVMSSVVSACIPRSPRWGCQPSFLLLFVSCSLLLNWFPVSIQACPDCLKTSIRSQGDQSFYTTSSGGWGDGKKKVAYNGWPVKNKNKQKKVLK